MLDSPIAETFKPLHERLGTCADTVANYLEGDRTVPASHLLEELDALTRAGVCGLMNNLETFHLERFNNDGGFWSRHLDLIRIFMEAVTPDEIRDRAPALRSLQSSLVDFTDFAGQEGHDIAEAAVDALAASLLAVDEQGGYQFVMERAGASGSPHVTNLTLRASLWAQQVSDQRAG